MTSRRARAKRGRRCPALRCAPIHVNCRAHRRGIVAMAGSSGAAERTSAYAEAGVDIDAGNRLIDLIAPLARATRRRGADAELGGFGALFDLKAAGFRDPVLVATTDGVGTRLNSS